MCPNLAFPPDMLVFFVWWLGAEQTLSIQSKCKLFPMEKMASTHMEFAATHSPLSRVFFEAQAMPFPSPKLPIIP